MKKVNTKDKFLDVETNSPNWFHNKYMSTVKRKCIFILALKRVKHNNTVRKRRESLVKKPYLLTALDSVRPTKGHETNETLLSHAIYSR